MNLRQFNKQFDSEEKCRTFLEELRWSEGVRCVRCNSERVRFNESENRYACNNCKTRFRVTTDTIFERSTVALRDWFVAINMILNAKQGYSAKQLQRNIGCTYKTAWYMAMRVRCAMIDPYITLQNIVEMDETYIGGKVRKVQKNTNDNSPTISTIHNKRGRGTSKTAVVGIVERQGKVVLEVTEQLTARKLLSMLKRHVDIDDDTVVMTDDFKSYKKFDEYVNRKVINHSKGAYSDGDIHTNTIEGFWSIVKNSIRGEYRAVSKKYLPFYLVQAQYIYNQRNETEDILIAFLRNAVKVDKDDFLMDYKPISEVKNLVYPIKLGRPPKKKVS